MTFRLISNVFTQIRHRLDGISFDMELSARRQVGAVSSQGHIKALWQLKK